MTSRVADRFSFAKIPEVLPLPDLLAVQYESFQWFIEEGLKEIFEGISPIEDFTGSVIHPGRWKSARNATPTSRGRCS